MPALDMDTATTPKAAYVQTVKTSSHQEAFLSDSLASIIKFPPKTPPTSGAIPYSDLVCTPTDQQKITRLITVMAENGKLTLLFKYQRELNQLGAEIDHVHPLKFLSTVFSNPELKSHMKEIRHDYFKWNGFLNGHGSRTGLADGLTNHAERGKLDPYINDFSKEVGIAPEVLQPFFQSRDWENLVCYLISH